MTLLKLTVVNIADRDMIAPTVTISQCRAASPQRKDCRDNIQRLGEGGRRGSYLGLDGRHHAPAHLLAELQVHVPVLVQVVFGFPNGLGRQPRTSASCAQAARSAGTGAGWAL